MRATDPCGERHLPSLLPFPNPHLFSLTAATVAAKRINARATGTLTVTLPLPADTGRHDYLLRARVATSADPRAAHLLCVVGNDTLLAGEGATRLRHVVCRIPPRVLEGRTELSLLFAGQHPDLPDVADPRVGATFEVTEAALLRVSRIDAPTPPDGVPPATDPESEVPHRFLLDFQSLGDNCEFGGVQRRMGCEPMGLLRFASTPYDSLLDMLHTRFARLLDSDALTIAAEDAGNDRAAYRADHSSYNFYYHTLVLTTDSDAAEVRRRQRGRLAVASRKLIEHLESGDRVFVHRCLPALTDAQLLVLHTALLAYGPATLLAVAEADSGHPAGSIEVLTHGLIRGRVKALAPYVDADRADDPSWHAVCRQAHAVWRRWRGAGAIPEPAAPEPALAA